MKVGTDAILLGSWVRVKDDDIVLDIGTGCGILSLMMAQKSDAKIDAIDIDHASINQAQDNINQTKWHNRICLYHTSVQEYARKSNKKYSFIITNPPYFHHALSPATKRKELAKHGNSLSFESLIDAVDQLLEKSGTFNLILPKESSERFKKMSSEKGLYLKREMMVSPKINKAVNRMMMCFSRKDACIPVSESIAILDTMKAYTESFKNLCQEFYIDM